MCIIIDTCCANDLSKRLPQAKLILDWVKAGGKVVSGGHLEKELRGTKLQALLVHWKASGRLISFNKSQVEAESESINSKTLKSNDIHIIALAKISGARAVVTRDRNLMHDLKRSGAVTPPRKIYPFPEDPVENLRIQQGVLRNSGCK